MATATTEQPTPRTLWLRYSLASGAGESKSSTLIAWSPEGVPVERKLASELYGSGLRPGTYRGWVEHTDATDIRKTVSGNGWETYRVPVEPGKREVEVEVIDLGHEQIFDAFREKARASDLKLLVTRHLTHTAGQHGNWKLSWGFKAVFSDKDKNRLELAACRTFRDWEGREEGYKMDAVSIVLAVAGKKLTDGAIPFEQWEEKLDLFRANLETLKAMGALRRGLLNLKK